jgi:primosomal protein N'
MVKPRKCPNCGSKSIAEILYGMPAYSEDLQKKMDEGTMFLGG